MRKIFLLIVLLTGLNSFGQSLDKNIQDGILKCKLRDYRGALMVFGQAIKSDPNSYLAYYYRGIVKTELRDYKGAVLDFDKSIELNSGNPDAFYERGLAKRKTGDYSGSNSDFAQARKIDPSSSLYNYREGHRPTFQLSDTASYSSLRNLTRDKFLNKYAIPDSVDVFDKRGFDLYSFFYFHEHDTCWIYFTGNNLQTILYLRGSDKWHVIEY